MHLSFSLSSSLGSRCSRWPPPRLRRARRVARRSPEDPTAQNENAIIGGVADTGDPSIIAQPPWSLTRWLARYAPRPSSRQWWCWIVAPRASCDLVALGTSSTSSLPQI